MEKKKRTNIIWEDKLYLVITFMVITLVGSVLVRIGFQLIENTICKICFTVVVVAIVYFVYEALTTKRREKDEYKN